MTIKLLKGRSGKSLELQKLYDTEETLVFEFNKGTKLSHIMEKSYYCPTNSLDELLKELDNNGLLSDIGLDYKTYVFYFNITTKLELDSILKMIQIISKSSTDSEYIITIQSDEDLLWEELNDEK